ncbi:MAG TPA: NAD(P)-dependent oxidoreductase [Candidatus Eisenbacteria bacterium]|nr:NAD(P)-dependent oxidoreductase [Candidatus Eisenbacteria bacterium]
MLVTGATGAIGRAVCRELVTHGYRVLGLARDAEARARLPYGVVAVSGDIRDPAPWESAIERSDVVIHLAVPSQIGQGKQEREDADRDADELTANLDRLCTYVRRHKKRLVHTFGALLYEPGPDGWVRESSPISAGRGFGIRHRKAYPVFARHRKNGLRAISVNPSFLYGAGGWFEQGVLEPMSRGQSSFIGDGTQTMHYIAASDAGVGYRLAIEKGLDGDDYLLADDRPSTLGEFTRLVAREMGAPEPRSVPEEAVIPILGSWKVEAYAFCPKVDSSKARDVLGWRPVYRTIETGVPVVVREWKRSRTVAA